MVENLYTIGLQVDTSQLERGTQTTRQALHGLGQAESQLERQTKQTTQATQQQAEGMKRTTRAAADLQTGMKGLGTSLQAARGLLTTMGAYLGGQLARSVMETAGQMQTLQLSLDAITGSTRAGADAMLFIRQTANQLGVGTAELAQNYRQFISATQGANLGLQTQRQLMTGLVAANKVAGGSTETLSNAMRALNQIIGLGKVTAENWTGQLEDALPGITNKTAAALDMTTEKFRDFMSAGQLGIDRVFPALIRVLGQDIPRAAAIAGSSIEGETARMKNSFTDLFSALGQSPMMQAFTKNMGDAVRWMHDFGASVGAINPRPLTAIEQITERINVLRRETNLSGQRSLETNQKLAELETQRLALIKLQTQQQKALTDQEAERKKAATTGPTGVTKTLTTQIDQETAAIQRRYTVGQTVGLPQLERERAKLSDLNKVLQEHLDVLASTTPMTDADRKAREAQAIATQDQIEATEGVIASLQQEERARTQAPKTGRRGLTEEQRAANDLQREQNQLIDEMTAAYDRATKSEADLLAIRASRLKFSATEIAELLEHQALTQAAEQETQRVQEQQQAYETLYAQLQGDLDIYNHALQQGIDLERARQEMAIETVARSDEELQILLAKNDARREAVTLLEAEEERLQAVASTAALMIEEQVRGPDVAVAEATESLRTLEEASEQFASTFLGYIQEVTDTGKFAFKDFAESVIQDLMRILQQQFLKPAMEGWVQAGLKLATGVLGGLGGGAGAAAGAGLSAATIAAGGGSPGLAVGGPLRNGLTLVGEAGPEAIVSRAGRSMVFPSSHPISRMAVRAHLPGRQYGGPLPSGGVEVGGAGTTALAGAMGGFAASAASAASAYSAVGGPLRSGLTLVGEAGPEAIVSRAGRSMVFPSSHPISRMAVQAHLPGREFGGPMPSTVMGGTGSEVMSQPSASGPGQVAPVIVNVYAQDAQSFIKSKGEIQRQMMSAWRSAQRS